MHVTIFINKFARFAFNFSVVSISIIDRRHKKAPLHAHIDALNVSCGGINDKSGDASLRR
jgi:hypothetical protein